MLRSQGDRFRDSPHKKEEEDLHLPPPFDSMLLKD